MNMKKAKGFLGGLVIEFAIAVFVVLAVLIFVYCFKIHITQAMVDYYLWGKENDIPMALFSSDINGESSAVALNRIFYNKKNGRDYDEWKTKMETIMNSWFIENSGQKTYQFYHFELDDVVIEKEVPCNCYAKSTNNNIGQTIYECAGTDCGSLSGQKSTETATQYGWDQYCKGACLVNTIEMKSLGLYPVPIIYNGTDRIVTLKFNTVVKTKTLK